MRVALYTVRLHLQPYRLSDIDALHQLWTDPAVRKYLWDDKVIPRERAAEVVTASLADWSMHGYGQWTIHTLDNHELIGFCGFRAAEEDKPPELLYGLAPAYWGQGLATEAAQAVLRYGFERLNFTRVWAATDPPNLASVRVLERLGMQFDRRDTLNGLDTVFYALSREQFTPAATTFVTSASD
jgi:ribosomal-protein-alanine N-acetyltransferase